MTFYIWSASYPGAYYQAYIACPITATLHVMYISGTPSTRQLYGAVVREVVEYIGEPNIFYNLSDLGSPIRRQKMLRLFLNYGICGLWLPEDWQNTTMLRNKVLIGFTALDLRKT